MPRTIVVLGGGVGGTLAANLIAKKLRPGEAEIVLVDEDGRHVYQPGFLYVAFGQKQPASLSRPVRPLLDRRVRLMTAKAKKIDPQTQTLTTNQGDLHYDELVIATGSHLAPEEVPGLKEATHHFYTMEGAQALREALREFRGGRVVVGVAGVPYKCPPAPLEFAMMLDSELRARGLRDKTEIHFTSPLPRVFPIESVAVVAAPMMEARGINIHTFFNVESVDPTKREVISLEGETLPYDLLVLIPPHRGAQVVIDSGLGEAGGWIPTDRHSLKAVAHPHMFAIGDATNLPISKSGSAAHFEADALVANLVADLRGQAMEHEYHGRVMCFLEVGGGKATLLNFDYQNPPHPPQPTRTYHWQKAAFNQFYWWTVPQGRLPGEKQPKPRAGKAGAKGMSQGD
ncbi:MAG: NAD(P)/FAD-dependent oxidoreductase [Symbiobacteriia bacterium]